MANQLLATLGVVCPGCDELNGAGSARCLACGASLRAPAKPPARPITVARLLLTVLGGSQEGRQFPLTLGTCGIGRSQGAVLFPDDPTLSPHQATLVFRDGRVYLRDEGAGSGVLIRIGAPERLLPHGQFSVGQRLFRYLGAIAANAPVAATIGSGRPLTYGSPLPAAPFLYGVEELLIGGRSGRVIVSGAPVLRIGQRGCDVAYPGDSSLALVHCELTPGGEYVLLRDRSGEQGTFVRLPAHSERVLQPGDSFRLGQQILRVEPLV